MGVKDAFGALAAVLLGAFFLLGYGAELVLAATAPANTPPTIPSDLEKFISLFSVGVAGVIAFWFGVAAPAAQNKDPGGARKAFTRIGDLVVPWGSADLKLSIGIFYFVAYFLVSALSFLLWLLRPDVTPDLLKAQATAGGGLLIAIGAGFAKQ